MCTLTTKVNSFLPNGNAQKADSTLSVIFHQRGRKAKCTDFLLEGTEKAMPVFSLKTSEDALKLAKFLELAVKESETAGIQKVDYSITGYGLKVMSFGNEIAKLNSLNSQLCDMDSFSYEGFRKMFLSLNSDDYYFVLYPHQSCGLGKECIETIVDACVSYQQAVIVSGDLNVFRPMRLTDIADMTGYDISTVSRACNGACVYTSHRNYPLSSNNNSSEFVGLFNQAVDETVSPHSVRDKITDIINSEDKNHPFSDEKIVEHLSKFGFDVARRTVVKYREQLDFPNSRERRNSE